LRVERCTHDAPGIVEQPVLLLLRVDLASVESYALCVRVHRRSKLGHYTVHPHPTRSDEILTVAAGANAGLSKELL
jgi:hypothetical protein